jgi:hypothetical protein
MTYEDFLPHLRVVYDRARHPLFVHGGRMKHAIGERPEIEGLYVVEIHFGWKLLEWHAGAWWHIARVGRWMADDPVQWVGPLPAPCW